ncbi:uncharacterized protein LOC120143239 [Hibiscus syriacus]|uniref:uncharacterized protein LOC120143239 n=1 Tax=Hibiscus syriacus TaxID=106335 RepID=UPI0019226DA4|nr:uncharacterized protein LOC120143239 [Hibiscus syriacus]
MSMEENNNATPLGEQTTFVAPSSNVRLKTDVAWRYVNELQDEHGRKSYFCTFCQKTFHGGGINRMKQHLAEVKAKEKRGCSLGIHTNLDEDEEVQKQTTKTSKRKASSNLQSFFKRGINDLSQPSIKSSMQSKERSHDTDMALALWFNDACIPMNAMNSPLFPIAMSKIASMGHGYNGPSYHDIRVNLLKDAKQSVHLIVESYQKNWLETGCTIMSDGWRDTRHIPLINFLVYFSKGKSFIKSVDASDIESNAQTLCNLFSEIVKIVGLKNVVHMITDNAANYKAAGKLLCEKYPSWLLNWLRKRPGWTEIIHPGATRFGIAFIALKSLHDHKNDLQAMVTSNDFKKVIKLPKAIEVKLIILDETFWKNCLISVNVMAPLLRLLRVCDSDEKPSLGYVYEGMYRAKNGIKKLFRFKKVLYRSYTNIIKARWDRMLRKSLHVTAYWLNPIFQYDQETFCQKAEVFSGVIEMVEKKLLESVLVQSVEMTDSFEHGCEDRMERRASVSVKSSCLEQRIKGFL